MKLHILLEMLEAGKVKRYHTLTTLKTQTLSQHCFRMLQLAYFITENNVSKELANEILFHDHEEYEIGDIPASFCNTAITKQKKIQEVSFKKSRGLYLELSMVDEGLLHCLDSLELMINCLEEVTLGNKYLKFVFSKGRLSLNNKMLNLGMILPLLWKENIEKIVRYFDNKLKEVE